MFDVQGVLVQLGNIKDRVIKFNWKKLVPKFKVEKYEYGAAGIDLTSSWGRTGLGVGFGLGMIDLWFGWPRYRESLHYAGCSHSR